MRRAQRVAGETQFLGPIDADETRQAHTQPPARQNAHPRMRVRKLGLRGRDDQIASQRQFETRGHRVAVDGGNHRPFERGDGLGHVLPDDALVETGGVFAAAAQFLEVHAGTESSPGTRHDGDANLGIGAKFPKRLPQGKTQLGGKGVHGVGAIERHGGYRTLLFHQQY